MGGECLCGGVAECVVGVCGSVAAAEVSVDGDSTTRVHEHIIPVSVHFYGS